MREKIIQTYEAGAITQCELAKRFRVSLYFVVLLLRRRRAEETIEPKKRRDVMKPLLTSEIMQFLSEQIERECNLSFSQPAEPVREKYKVSF